MYLGAAVVACAAAAFSFQPATLTSLTTQQLVVLLYLGAIASGVGFFLFNAGARWTDVGTLAIFNNVKVPLAVLASVLFFGDVVNWPRLLIGGVIIGGALVLNEQFARKAA
jgi:drug/metabolite transporter (DMT)-like permease